MTEIEKPKQFVYKRSGVDMFLLGIVLFTILVFVFIFSYNQWMTTPTPTDSYSASDIQDLLDQKRELEEQIDKFENQE